MKHCQHVSRVLDFQAPVLPSCRVTAGDSNCTHRCRSQINKDILIALKGRKQIKSMPQEMIPPGWFRGCCSSEKTTAHCPWKSQTFGRISRLDASYSPILHQITDRDEAALLSALLLNVVPLCPTPHESLCPS